MNKIIKIVLISALLPLISGCSKNFKEFFEDKPDAQFEIALNGGAVIKCSRGKADSLADNVGDLAKKLAEAKSKFSGSPVPVAGDSKNNENNLVALPIDYEKMMITSALDICDHVTGRTEPAKPAETQKN